MICTADVMGIAFASAPAAGWAAANASDAPASITAEPSATNNPVTAQKVTRESHERCACSMLAPQRRADLWIAFPGPIPKVLVRCVNQLSWLHEAARFPGP